MRRPIGCRTATVRPPVSVTDPLKRASMVAYGESGPIGAYEEDHLVALGAGGSPSDPRNLWAEPGPAPTGRMASKPPPTVPSAAAGSP